MSETSPEGEGDVSRATWATRTGFIFAAAGTAVGIGNVWRFPFKTADEGGAAFLLVYVAFLVVVGVPLILLEFSIGRETRLSPVSAFDSLASGVYRYLGWPMVATAFLVLSYYTVVSGWMLRYTVMAAAEGYPSDVATAEAWFFEIASGVDAVLFHGLFLLLTASVVAFGVKRGIEVISLTLFPLSLALLASLAVFAYRLDGATGAYGYFLRPDLEVVAGNWHTILPSAAGQAFFTLSVGAGIMLTYASYVEEDRSLVGDSFAIAGIDTAVAVAVGLVVFPVMFAAGLSPTEPGHSAFFVTVSTAFGSIQGGELFGFVFFGTVSVAALLTSVALLEVLVCHMLDEEGMMRREVLAVAVTLLFVVGLPAALDIRFLDVVDVFAVEVLLVATMLVISVYLGWRHGEELADTVFDGELSGLMRRSWIWLIRIPVVAVLIVTLATGAIEYGHLLRELFGG